MCFVRKLFRRGPPAWVWNRSETGLKCLAPIPHLPDTSSGFCTGFPRKFTTERAWLFCTSSAWAGSMCESKVRAWFARSGWIQIVDKTKGCCCRGQVCRRYCFFWIFKVHATPPRPCCLSSASCFLQVARRSIPGESLHLSVQVFILQIPTYSVVFQALQNET